MRDTIYDLPQDPIARFVFDEQVVRVFPDMINRSVPGYGHVLAMTGVLAAHYAQPATQIYDLGCSLGASSRAVLQHLRTPIEKIVAVDNAPAMIEGGKRLFAEIPNTIDWHCIDIQQIPIQRASVVMLNFTLQFLPIEARLPLLTRIFAGTQAGGALILSEKICFEDPKTQTVFEALHADFKRANGYTDLEIQQKRAAIENYLIPETLETHIKRLHQIGYHLVEVWFQSLNFASILALK